MSILNEFNDPEFQQVQPLHFGGQLGASMAAVAELNAYGTTDLIARVPRHVDVTDAADETLNAGAAFRSALANAGDVDGDGASDVLIGAPGEGHVFVFSGRTGNLLFDIASPVTEDLHSFGAAVAGGKDFNRDGKPDFVVGSPNFEGLRGTAYIFNGSDGSLQRTLLPQKRQPFAKFGSSLCVSDDLTGDRRPDVAVGAPGQNVNGLLQAGAITVLDGRHRGAVQTISSA